MKILYITYNGSEDSIFYSQVLLQLCRLAKAGYEISLLSFEKRLNEKVEQTLSDYKIKWYRLKYHKNLPLPSTIFDICAGVIYGGWIAKMDKIGIIHSRQVVCGCIGLLIKKLLGIRLLYDMRGKFAEEKVSHGWKYKGLKYRLVKSIDNMIKRNADAIVVLTERHFRELEGIARVIPCSVDLNKFRYSAKERNALRLQMQLKDKFVLVYAGSLGTCYFFNEMLDFFLVAEEYFKGKAFFLLLVNNISLDIYQMIMMKGISGDNYRLISARPEAIPAFLSASDAGIFFINPYMKSGSSPIKFAEFLACGLPVVLNNGIGDTDKLVAENNIGVVIDEFTDKCYLSAIKRLTRVDKKACRNLAQEQFSLDKAVEEYSSIYERSWQEMWGVFLKGKLIGICPDRDFAERWAEEIGGTFCMVDA